MASKRGALDRIGRRGRDQGKAGFSADQRQEASNYCVPAQGGPIDNGTEQHLQDRRTDTELRHTFDPQRIERISIGDLKPNPRNARRHSDAQIELIAESIIQFGFIGVVVIDNDNNVLAGHGRLAGAKLAGLRVVTCIRADHLDEAGKKAFALGDNRLAELSDWDNETLKVELQELESMADFDLAVTGFDSVDLDRLLGPEPLPNDDQEDDNGISRDPDDVLPELDDHELAVSEQGDVWLAGKHRILCGDALNPESYERLLLRGEEVAQVITDPPYNVRIRGHVTSKRQFREFAMASGEMSQNEFVRFLTRSLHLAIRACADGAILHVFMDWRHAEELLAAARAADLTLLNICVWAKPSPAMGSLYRAQHELVFVLRAGRGPHTNNIRLGSRGRNRSNVWRYSSVRGPRRGVTGPDGGHPTVKPTASIVDMMKDCSNRGDVILDPFCGSGTTLIAAERIGRKARLVEIDPHYVDLTVRRWQAATGRSATLEDDSRTFAEVAAERKARSRNDERYMEDAGLGEDHS